MHPGGGSEPRSTTPQASTAPGCRRPAPLRGRQPEAVAGGLAVTPEAPGQLDSLQYRQIQIADLLEQLRGRGPGERFRQRVPPLPVLVLQRQERLHRVVPLLWPRPDRRAISFFGTLSTIAWLQSLADREEWDRRQEWRAWLMRDEVFVRELMKLPSLKFLTDELPPAA